MNSKQATGKRNLLILSWMGLSCQAVGVAAAVADMAGLPLGSVLGGASLVTFGIALGGWAGNLGEIIELKRRISALEGRSAP